MILKPEYVNGLCLKSKSGTKRRKNWFLDWSYESILPSFCTVFGNNCLCGSVLLQCASLQGAHMSRYKVSNVWVFIYHSTQRNMAGLIFNNRLSRFLFITSVYTFTTWQNGGLDFISRRFNFESIFSLYSKFLDTIWNSPFCWSLWRV